MIFLIFALALVALTGCAGNQNSQSSSLGDTRFVAGDGKVELFAPASRRAAPAVEGSSLEGETVRLNKSRVTVINFWASWCAPCRIEAPALKDIAAETKSRGVEFIGINFKDQKSSALAFERGVKSGYPSIYDQSGRLLLAFQGTVPPAAIPSTLIIDRHGRIAARALGAVKYSDLLKTLTEIMNEP
ncbi:TlpA family protein disulfide reductase [Sphaerimonospora sp. CA-214678]|uniref:TlpA family protein disulfide reductase n=1 Tax=Sphaerimonospora sp. CA-214678 TaxID=3240029 RepID=UPI003D921CF2